MGYPTLAGVLLKVRGNARAQEKNSLLKCQVATALNVIVKVNSDGIHCHRTSKYNLGEKNICTPKSVEVSHVRCKICFCKGQVVHAAILVSYEVTKNLRHTS